MNHPIASAKYVSFVSYRRDGTPVATPVWIAPLGNDFGFTIDNKSGKAKRLAHTNRATVQECDVKGKVAEGTPVYQCTAKVVLHGEAEIVRDAIAKKYTPARNSSNRFTGGISRFTEELDSLRLRPVDAIPFQPT
jgi:PPOX class probable F420-dependent enzyme